MGDRPEGPYHDAIEGPWTFMGELTGPAKDSFTIHPGIIDYKGHSYLFYNPDGTLQRVEQTKKGISK